jgi:putative phage-type endonuclease
MLISELPIIRNIISLFNLSSLISSKDIDEIQLTLGDLMDNYIENCPLAFSSPNFHRDLDEYVISIIIQSIGHLYTDKELLSSELSSIYNSVKKQYFTKDYPYRSYPKSFIRKSTNIEKMTKKINFIENKPQPDQRTSAWYEFRHNLITASSAWKAFKSQSTINQLVVEKCKPLDLTRYDGVNTSTPMHHGNKFEDVSIMFYEALYKTKVKDYGCIQHDKHKFLGASPDGINVDPLSDRYGRMVEIKNPTTREINGIPKEDYWIQMQLQMETCDLNECDFLETVFKEYEDEESFMKDGSFIYNENKQLKGVIAYFMKNGKPLYEYMPLYNTEDEHNIWFDTMMEKHKGLTWVKNIYWRLQEYSCVLVLRNKCWFQSAVIEIENVWKIIELEKHTGYEHRMSKKNVRTSRSNSLTEQPQNNSCLVDVNKLQNQIIYINTNFELMDISGAC